MNKKKKQPNNSAICYLCSKVIKNYDKESCDHVIHQQFIKREQPRVKGFDYGGFLPTHELCNNKFGGFDSNAEVICQKALRVIQVLHDPSSSFKRQHRYNPEINVIFTLNTKFEDFSKNEREYFGLIDVSKKDYKEWSDPKFFKYKSPMEPMEKPLNSALSVLVKSSAALLIKRHNVPPCSF